jgi:hypothetical protein
MFQILQSLSTFEILTLIGGAIGMVWWMSAMFSETKQSRIANQQTVEAFNEVKGEVKEIRNDHGPRIVSLETWRAVKKAQDRGESE